MKENERVFVFREGLVFVDQELEEVVTELVQLNFKRAAPRYSILLFFLDVLDWHARGVVHQSREAMHHGRAKLATVHTITAFDLLLDQARGAVSHPSLEIKVFLVHTVRHALRVVLFGCGEG